MKELPKWWMAVAIGVSAVAGLWAFGGLAASAGIFFVWAFWNWRPQTRPEERESEENALQDRAVPWKSPTSSLKHL
jgi:hypothetical protein